MKDKSAGKIMTKFVALRTKLHAYKHFNTEKPEDKQCKRIMKCLVKNTLMFDDYKKCLYDGGNVCREQMLFQTKDHEVYTSKSNKIVLNRDDDKWKIQADQISTLAA